MKKPTYEQLEQKILQLEQKISQLQAVIEVLQKENAQLKSRLNQNSRNSSRPPSTDQKSNSPDPERPKQSSPHHPGANRKLLPENMVTSYETREITTCPRCRSKMEPTEESSKWQQVEIPPIAPSVHQIELRTCRCFKCGLVQTPQLAHHETYLMGPRLEGFVNILMAKFRHSHLGVRSLLSALIPGLELSQGLVSKAKQRGAKAFDSAMKELQEEILKTPGEKFMDATGWRHLGKNYFAIILRNVSYICYFLRANQNGATIADILGKRVDSLLVDRGLAIQKVVVDRLQYCLAHFLRNLLGLAENESISDEETQKLGEIYDAVQGLFHDKHRQERLEISADTLRAYGHAKWTWIRDTVEDLEASTKAAVLRRFCRKALKNWKNFKAYLRSAGSMTNNRAEEGLRNLVIARKLCFGSRSSYGLKWRESIQSCVETLQRQGKSFIDFFAETIRAYRLGEEYPRIVGYSKT